MAALTTAIIVGASIAAVGATAGAIISSSAQRDAAKKQARAQQQAITSQERIAREQEEARAKQVEQERIDREAAIKREEEGRTAALAKQQEAVAKIQGFKPAAEITPGPEVLETLRERIAGRGVGPQREQLVTPIDVKKTTAPFAAQRRAGVEIEKAAIGATASAAGLGRSILPVRQTAEAVRAGERDIESRAAELQVTNKDIELANARIIQLNETQKRVEINDALARLQRFSELEAELQREKDALEFKGDFATAETLRNDIVALEDKRRQDVAILGALDREGTALQAANEFNLAQTIKERSITEAANDLIGMNILASGISEATKAFGSSISQSNDELLDVIQQSKQERGLGAQVQISERDRLLGTSRSQFEQDRILFSGR